MHNNWPDVPANDDIGGADYLIDARAITCTLRRDVPPLHPGQILVEDFMRPQNISRRALAEALQVSHTRIAGITRGTAAISADTAVRLAHYFDTSPWFWMNLQVRFDLQVADRQMPHPTECIAPLPLLVDPGVLAVPESKGGCVW